jgi:hypothetical protein
VSKIVVGFLLLALAGCAAPPLPELGPDHPASPEAAEAPLRPVSETLSTREAHPAPADSPERGEHHGH